MKNNEIHQKLSLFRQKTHFLQKCVFKKRRLSTAVALKINILQKKISLVLISNDSLLMSHYYTLKILSRLVQGNKVILKLFCKNDL